MFFIFVSVVLLMFCPFFHEKLLFFEQIGTFLRDPRRQQEKVHMTIS